LLSDYYKNQYSKENRRDRDIHPEEYFGENSENKYPFLKHYFERSRSQSVILHDHGAVFDKVLDYGSGPGYFLKICGAKEPYAVDPDRSAEKYLHYINAKIIEKDELPTDFFDVVVASHVVEHFDAKNAISIIHELLQSLKKDGLLLVEVPQGGHSYLHIAHPHHAPHTIFFTPEGILKLIKNAGAEILDAFPRDIERCYPRNPLAIYAPDMSDSFLSTQHECLTIIAKKKAYDNNTCNNTDMHENINNTQLDKKYKQVNVGNYQKYGCRYPIHYERFKLTTELLIKLALNNTNKLDFLDIGGRDTKLRELRNVSSNFSSFFEDKYNYYCLDIENFNDSIVADICDKSMLDNNPMLIEKFDVVYSNNVFEHLADPFVAAKNMHQMLKANSHGIIFAPFSWRYHEVPVDFFRYTYTGLVHLFQHNSLPIEVIDSGFDITERRNILQGFGYHKGIWLNDICPEDEMGAWREHWQSILMFKKIGY
jgi:SAM-dependent methyltransferase